MTAVLSIRKLCNPSVNEDKAQVENEYVCFHRSGVKVLMTLPSSCERRNETLPASYSKKLVPTKDPPLPGNTKPFCEVQSRTHTCFGSLMPCSFFFCQFFPFGKGGECKSQHESDSFLPPLKAECARKWGVERKLG